MSRTSLNGAWILDKTRNSDWVMKPYLEIMQVDPLAIEAHEKGDLEADTIHTIELNDRRVRIVKRSRVNNDLTTELDLETEKVEYLSPGERPKTQIARSAHAGHLEIQSSLQTLHHGVAQVTDVKELIQNDDESVWLLQKLTIENVQQGTSHTVTRYFKPYLKTPPHLEGEAVQAPLTRSSRRVNK